MTADNNIIIKPADKGGATVIMNKKDYIQEANRQLSNTLHYKKLSEPIHPKISNKVNSIINNLHKHKYLNKNKLITSQYRKTLETENYT